MLALIHVLIGQNERLGARNSMEYQCALDTQEKQTNKQEMLSEFANSFAPTFFP